MMLLPGLELVTDRGANAPHSNCGLMDELWQEVWRRIPAGPRLEATAPIPCPPPMPPRTLPPAKAKRKPLPPADGRLNCDLLRRLPDGTRILLAKTPGGPTYCRLLHGRGAIVAVLESDPTVTKSLSYRRDIYLGETG